MDNTESQIQQLMQSQPAPRLGGQTGQIADIFSVSGAALQGQPNPVQQQQQAEMQRKMQLIKLQQSVQDQRMKKAQMQIGIGRSLLEQDSPAGKKMGARVMADQLKQMGVQVDPGFEEGLATSPLSLDKRKDAYVSILAGASDDYLESQMNVPKQMIPELKKQAGSDAIHKLLFGKTPQQEQLEIQKSGLEYGKFQLMEMRQDLAEQRQRLSEIKEDRLRLEGQAKLDLQERRVTAAEGLAKLSQAKFDYAQAHGPEEKRLKALDHGDLFVSQMEEVANRLDAKGFLPKTSKGAMGGLLSGDSSALQAKAKRLTDSNDPDWQTFSKHLKGEMVGYTRSVQNDIGPRAMAAFQGALDIMDHPPSMDALKSITTRMRQAIKLSREGSDTAQTLYIQKPTGQIVVVPWKRGMSYESSDKIVRIE